MTLLVGVGEQTGAGVYRYSYTFYIYSNYSVNYTVIYTAIQPPWTLL